MGEPAELAWGWRWLLVGGGGAIGSICRYELTRWSLGWNVASVFPMGTFMANVLGSFILGLAAALILQRLPAPLHWWYLLFGVGFCGGFTTFSTFSSETYRLWVDGKPTTAAVYVLASIVGGLAAIVAGIALGHLLVKPAAP